MAVTWSVLKVVFLWWGFLLARDIGLMSFLGEPSGAAIFVMGAPWSVPTLRKK